MVALVKCPECGSDVSEKARFCPKCGDPGPFLASLTLEGGVCSEAEAKERVAEYLRLGAEREEGYVRLDKREKRNRTIPEIFRLIFSSEARRIMEEEMDEARSSILDSGARMRELEKQIPSKYDNEIRHLWDGKLLRRIADR